MNLVGVASKSDLRELLRMRAECGLSRKTPAIIFVKRPTLEPGDEIATPFGIGEVVSIEHDNYAVSISVEKLEAWLKL